MYKKLDLARIPQTSDIYKIFAEVDRHTVGKWRHVDKVLNYYDHLCPRLDDLQRSNRCVVKATRLKVSYQWLCRVLTNVHFERSLVEGVHGYGGDYKREVACKHGCAGESTLIHADQNRFIHSRFPRSVRQGTLR